MAVGIVIVFYQQIRQSSEQASTTIPGVTVVAPSQAECHQIRDLFTAWLDSDPPITIELTRRLTDETVGAVLAGGLAFAAGLDRLPEGLARYLRDAVRDYNEALQALSDELSHGSASAEQTEEVLSLATLVHNQYTSFSQEFCP